MLARIGMNSVFRRLKSTYFETVKNTVNEINFIDSRKDAQVPLYQLLNPDGKAVKPHTVDDGTLVKILDYAQNIRVMDDFLNNCHRQGRISFYMRSFLEEVSIISSCAALEPNDMIFSQYREMSALYWRGYPMEEIVHTFFGNVHDRCKGRQMPLHFSVPELSWFSISSPLTTQLIQCAGAAFAFKSRKENRVGVTYFGDGSTSEGDFHAAMNFSSVLKCPVLFLCRNNQYAISTPIAEQHVTDSYVTYAKSYSMPGIRVDGSDALAVYTAVKEARKLALAESTPVFIEMFSYRGGDHSTSDDSTYYRNASEIDEVMQKYDGIGRLKKYLTEKGLVDAKNDENIAKFKESVIKAIKVSENTPYRPINEMFDDVYDKITPRLQKAKDEILEHVKTSFGEYSGKDKHRI